MCCGTLKIWQVCGSLQAVMPVSEASDASDEHDVFICWHLCFDYPNHNPVNSTITYRKISIFSVFIYNEKSCSSEKCVFIF